LDLIIAFIRLIRKVNTMYDSTLDLFCNHEDDQLADEYAMEIEMKAAILEVTVDYYMMEFM
jgi:hypothetical protein